MTRNPNLPIVAVSDPIKVALLTDDPLLRAGLSSLLAQLGSIDVVERDRAEGGLWGAGVDAGKTLSRLGELRNLPMPTVAVVGDPAHVAPALAAGARGVVLRDQVGPGIHAAPAAARAQGPRRAHRARAPGRPAPRRGSVQQADRRPPRHQRPYRQVPRQRR